MTVDAAGSLVVAPLAGAWIETLVFGDEMAWTKSRPLRARGLKQAHPDERGHPREVAPLAGAWIEIHTLSPSMQAKSSRPLRARGLKQHTVDGGDRVGRRRAPCGRVD